MERFTITSKSRAQELREMAAECRRQRAAFEALNLSPKQKAELAKLQNTPTTSNTQS